MSTLPDSQGRFGPYGGRYVPETLMPALLELEEAYAKARNDRRFQNELTYYLRQYVGRPTSLYRADRLSKRLGGARIYLKREDLCHTGAHKVNNTLGQVLLADRMGKPRVIAETGAGQHGVATATVCAKFGFPCVVYMGAVDVERQALNVFRMKLLGAEVRPVTSGTATLKDAGNEAMRDWIATVRDTHYILGSAVGPHPFPTLVRDFQSVIGRETREQVLEREGRLPDAVIACVGGGSNAIGMFHPFVGDEAVRLIGVEAAGEGVETEKHAATITKGRPGVFQGALTYLLQDEWGQIQEAHSISAGLDYPGVGPEHSSLKARGRAEYASVTDAEALDALGWVSRTEGILPALETAHAFAHVKKLAPTMDKSQILVVCLSGRGDKDVDSVRKRLETA